MLHLHLFHLLQTLSPHSVDLDVGVPARGLHGEAYRGHVFWDELFVLPVLNLRLPELTRALLLYRYRRLPQARRAARAAGHAGARCTRGRAGSNGREETQQLHLNPRSGRWLPDPTHLQRHVRLGRRLQRLAVLPGHRRPRVPRRPRRRDAAGDRPLLAEPRHLRPRPATAIDIRGVMGPDEYHDRLPGQRRARARQQRLHQRHGRLGAAPGARRAATCCPTGAAGELLEALGISRGGARALGATSAAGCACRSTTTGSSASSRATSELGRARLGRLPAAVRRHPAGSTASSRPRATRPNRYQAVQAGRRADAVLPALRRRAAASSSSGSATAATRTRSRAPSTTTCAAPPTGRRSARVVHAWVLARGDRARRWSYFLQALAQRRRRRPGRHHRGGHPPRRDGRHRRPAAALLRRPGDPRRRALVQPALAAPLRPAWSSPSSTGASR